MSIIPAISDRVIQLLNERNWTAYKLSTESGLPTSTVSNIILGKCKSCNLITLVNICRGFRIELYEFLCPPTFLLKNLDDND